MRRLMTPMYELLGVSREGDGVMEKEFRFAARNSICRTGYQQCIEEARESMSLILPVLESESNETE